ncbi:hypothetical protein BASA81_007527 [Batrachochytrium salamandrivorans]|nr:hypothetical protein BASA81_007527 [Batrachochytrium salamandrivorans]
MGSRVWVFGLTVFAAVGALSFYYVYSSKHGSKRRKPLIASSSPKEFLLAVELAGKITNATNEQMLQLYGLYKHVCFGALDEQVAPPWEPTARAKHFAWKQCTGLSKQDAEKLYVSLVKELIQSPTSSNKPQQFSGPKVSTMVAPSFATPTTTQRDPKLMVFDIICEDFARLNDEVLVLNAAVLTQKDEEDRTLLHWAVDEDNLSAVRFLLSKHAVDVDAADVDGVTPLGYACTSQGMEEIIQALVVEGGANPLIAGGHNVPASALCRRNPALQQRMEHLERGGPWMT